MWLCLYNINLKQRETHRILNRYKPLSDAVICIPTCFNSKLKLIIRYTIPLKHYINNRKKVLKCNICLSKVFTRDSKRYILSHMSTI